MQKWKSYKSTKCLKTGQRADVSASAFFSAHEAKSNTLYKYNLLTADLNREG